ncbi:hypothetical protein Plhal703r1_c24g0102841 [Plasmopara halstedii]
MDFFAYPQFERSQDFVMHLRYLRTSLLVGLLITDALARTTSTSTSPRSRHLHAADDDSQNSMNIDGENRTNPALSKFMKEVLGLNQANRRIESWKKADEILAQFGVNPTSELLVTRYNAEYTSKNFLASPVWICWAFLVCQSGVKVEDAIKHYIRERNRGHQNSKFFFFAVKLRNHLWKDHGINPDNMLAQIDTTNFFGVDFDNWVAYLSFYHGVEENHDFRFLVLKDLIRYYTMHEFLKILFHPNNGENTKALEYLKMLSGFWLSKKISPVDVVKMIASHDDMIPSFLDDVENKFCVDFWRRYLGDFNHMYPKQPLTQLKTLTEAVGPARVAVMLRAALLSSHHSVEQCGIRLQGFQFKDWFDRLMSAGDVRDLIANDLANKPWTLESPSISSLAETTSTYYFNFCLNRFLKF